MDKITEPSQDGQVGFKFLTRQQLKKVLGGDHCCTCFYGDGTNVNNECDDDDNMQECCGPAGVSMNCYQCFG